MIEQIARQAVDKAATKFMDEVEVPAARIQGSWQEIAVDQIPERENAIAAARRHAISNLAAMTVEERAEHFMQTALDDPHLKVEGDVAARLLERNAALFFEVAEARWQQIVKGGF